MRPVAFRITNFRSIVDSGWTPFSPDSITVLVGQNESGKTSVLEALHCAFSTAAPTPDDFRIGAPRPVVYLKVELQLSEGREIDPSAVAGLAMETYLQEVGNKVLLKFAWEKSDPGGTALATRTFDDNRYSVLLDEANAKLANEEQPEGLAPQTATGAPSEEEADGQSLSADEFVDEIWKLLPLSVLFNEETGRLPNTVDIDAKGRPTGPGAAAAANFLQVAEIDLPGMLAGDTRLRENLLNKANARVSKDFGAFWSQTIGKEGKLTLKCDLRSYDASVGSEKAGKPHLVFWINDGTTQLFPKQRSQGVRWFVSFYLQLKSSEKSRQKRLFLLDEPGANLHSKAQADVLRLVNALAKDTSSVVYTTHSPQLIEHSKLYRVHAVQRDGDLDDSPSVIIDAHRLGAASTDTLSPVLSAMGADLSQHQVIRQRDNVLLEEISGFYYLSSFWRLVGCSQVAHFISATGVNKLESLANMFRGWGLQFVVAVDDDKQGREVFKNLKRDLFGDDEKLAAQNLIKLPNGTGIEDNFSHDDFKKYVLCDPSVSIGSSIGEYLKSAGRSKPVLAFQFNLAVERGNISLKELSPATQQNIQRTVDSVATLLIGKTR